MQQLVILLVINSSSTCFGRLYAHHQEVRLCFTAYGVLSYCSCCDFGESGDNLSPPDDGRKDARNMLKKN